MLLTLITTTTLVAAPTVATAHPAVGWEGTWATSVHKPVSGFTETWAESGFDNHTLRQVVRISQGGPAVRVRLSNTYGSTPLRITSATVAKAGAGAAVEPDSVRRLTFRHSARTEIPVGREAVSDPVRLPVRPLEELTVTLYFSGPTGPSTFHWYAGATSWRATGDHVADTGAGAFTETSTSWYYLSGVDVLDPTLRRDAVVTFGDSITDGALSTQDANNRYPDELAERLGGRKGVLNAGIGGNRVLNDSECLGERAVARFERDALSQPGVRTVIVLEGINDIGFSVFENECTVPNPVVTAAELVAGHKELIRQARERGVRIVGATLLPYKGAGYYTEAGEAVRDQVNAWIRTSGEYDAVIDFDRVMADPADPDAMNPAYDSGDRLHPNDAGYRAMAAAIPVGTL